MDRVPLPPQLLSTPESDALWESERFVSQRGDKVAFRPLERSGKEVLTESQRVGVMRTWPMIDRMSLLACPMESSFFHFLVAKCQKALQTVRGVLQLVAELDEVLHPDFLALLKEATKHLVP